MKHFDFRFKLDISKARSNWRFQEQAVLMDLSNSTTLKLDVEIEDHIAFDSFQIGLGIDSVTNDAGVMVDHIQPKECIGLGKVVILMQNSMAYG